MPKNWFKEFRITPFDGKHVSETEFSIAVSRYGIDKMAVYEEGGDGTKKSLHYHGVFEGNISEEAWRRMLRDLSHEPPQDSGKINGNRLYFSRDPHEKTFQYIAKYKIRVFRYGYDQEECEEWERNADEYRRQMERERKADGREREEEMMFVYEETKKWFAVQVAAGRWSVGTGWSMRHDKYGGHYTEETVTDSVVDFVLKLCDENDIKFPVRTQMEILVLRIVYKQFPQVVRNHYVKIFS